MKLSPEAQRALLRTANAFLGVWLFVVLFAYFGVLTLTGLVADLAAATVLLVIANMIWKYALQPLFGRRSKRS